MQAMPQQQMPAAMPQAAPAAAPAPAAPAATTEGSEDADSKYITVKSPMIGTFYRSPSPDKPVYIEVGSEVKVGDTVCIIEAMKLFNEIESEVQGKIVKVLRSEEHTSELQSRPHLVCRLLLEKKKTKN